MNAVDYYGSVGFNGNQAIELRLENINDPSGRTGGNIIFNPVSKIPKYFNGTEWKSFSDAATSIQFPENTCFVSPNFTDIAPFFSSINSAISSSNNGDYIIVFPGQYNESIDFSKRHTYLHNNVTINGESILSSSDETSLSGHGMFYNSYNSNPSLIIYGDVSSNNFNHSVEFEYAMSVKLDAFSGTLKCKHIYYLLEIMGSLVEGINKKMYITASYIKDINISALNTKVYMDVSHIEGHLEIVSGEAEIEFKTFGMDTTLGVYKVLAMGSSSSKIAKLKLIDGSLPENWNNTAPILIGDYAQVDLQHVWVKNTHNQCIMLTGNVLNSHLLKIDNCILIANIAIDANISAQDVYCFGSWGQNDVSSNIVMRTEQLNVGAIW